MLIKALKNTFPFLISTFSKSIKIADFDTQKKKDDIFPHIPGKENSVKKEMSDFCSIFFLTPCDAPPEETPSDWAPMVQTL